MNFIIAKKWKPCIMLTWNLFDFNQKVSGTLLDQLHSHNKLPQYFVQHVMLENYLVPNSEMFVIDIKL